MSKFGSAVIDTTEKKFGPKYITYGIQELKINSLEIKVAGTGSKQVIFNVEGRPVTDPGFEGVDGAEGLVGRIKTMYMKSEQETNIEMTFAKIADAIGQRDKLNAIKSDSFEDYISKVNEVITGKFANFVVSGEGYLNNTNGKINYNLGFPRYDFVEKIGTTPSKLKFDKTNEFHYKDAVIPSNIGTPSSATAVKSEKDDLPF